MDPLFAILGSVLVEVGKCFCGPLHLKMKNFAEFRSNVKNLEEESMGLWNLKIMIEEVIGAAQEREKKKRMDASLWLGKVEEIKIKVTSLQKEITANKEKLYGCCLNFSLRSRLSKQVAENLKHVKRVRDECAFTTGVVAVDYKVKAVEKLPGPSILGQRTALVNLEKVTCLLKSDSCGIIGIWGMGGVGKTTLIRNLNNELGSSKESELFHVVIWVTVSKDLDLEKLQDQISERLNMSKSVKESMERMANRLYDRLSRGKFLLILDDVWEKIDLDRIGVPQPGVHIGCKIILTTRSREVCAEMKTDKDLKLNILGEDEAWNLFCDNAGEVVSSSHIEFIAKQVARECCGLPLAIITVGKAMRGKTMVELWRDALKQLQVSSPVPFIKGLEKDVFLPLKWSYDLLEGKNIKSCFLYCSLYPEDFSIHVKELVWCLVADGIIDEQQSVDETFNRGVALIENLKDCCLLEVGSRQGTVRMHDVVRDAAIWISSSLENGNRSLIQSGMRLNEITEGQNWKSLKRVSFMDNKIKSLPDRLLQCSEVTTLLLQGNPLGSIPEVFLQGFHALRVLNLSSTLITTLPHSLSELGGLHALLLRRCRKLRSPWSVQGLHKLQMLDLSYCPIRNLPEGMKGMKSLKYLNLSQTIFLETIPTGTLSGLSCLEVLDLSYSKYKLNINRNISGEATLDELSSLNHLAELDICVSPVKNIDDVIQIGRLRKFIISIGQTYQPSFPYSERTVVLGPTNLDDQKIHWLLKCASGLVLHDCTGYSGFWLRDHESSLSSLKSLSLDCLKWSHGAVKKTLPNLEEMYLQRVEGIQNLTKLLDLVGSNLRIINITNCYCTRLISSEIFHKLQNLREIEASHCTDMIELLSDDGLSEDSLPNLKIVKIKNLPKLGSICTRATTWPNIEQIDVDACPALSKLPLTVGHEKVTIRGTSEWWDKLEMDDEDSKSRLQKYLQQPNTSNSTMPPEIWKDTTRPGSSFVQLSPL